MLQAYVTHSSFKSHIGLLTRFNHMLPTHPSSHISDSSHASIICYSLILQVTYRTPHTLQSYVTHSSVKSHTGLLTCFNHMLPTHPSSHISDSSHASIICYSLILQVTYRTAYILQSYVNHSSFKSHIGLLTCFNHMLPTHPSSHISDSSHASIIYVTHSSVIAIKIFRLAWNRYRNAIIT